MLTHVLITLSRWHSEDVHARFWCIESSNTGLAFHISDDGRQLSHAFTPEQLRASNDILEAAALSAIAELASRRRQPVHA
jgi:hypothetical protein